jgi:hypothetical protein
MSEASRKHHETQEEIWRKLSEELGGQFVNETGWRQDKVRVRHGEWSVILDFGSHRGYRYEAIYTRFRGACANPDGFRVHVFRQELVHGLGRLLGMQDVRVGDPKLDPMFVIKTNDEGRVRRLMDDEPLRTLMQNEPDLEVTIRDRSEDFSEAFPEGVDELVVEVPGKIEEKEHLRRLYDIFGLLLGRIASTGK